MAEEAVPVGESLGARLTQIRMSQGRTQLRIAELLCAASGLPTVTRHEISRWERELRVPSAYWLRWLAVVLDVPLGELERAAAVTRASRSGLPPAVVRSPGGRSSAARRRWSTAELRRLDDLIGGAGLSAVVNAALRAEAAAARIDPARRRLAGLAELAQLAGWVNADAGDPRAARAAHRLGLRAAHHAGNPALVGHLLGSAAQVTADPVRALALAAAGAEEVVRAGSATARALALHRVAHAAALAGDTSRCERAISAAEHMYGQRRPEVDPPWVYWLTEAEFAAMTGRCYAMLRRPRLAVALLGHGLAGVRHPRSAALYRGWLAEAHLDAGSPDAAAPLAARALLDAVRAGSVRAAARARALHARLAAAPRSAVDGYLRVAAGALDYLADATAPGAAAVAGSG